MALCVSCGGALKDKARFCPFCGAEQPAREPFAGRKDENVPEERQSRPEKPASGKGPGAAGEKDGGEVEYVAFISYRHRPLDRAAAVRIQRSIENYVVPKGLRKKPGEKKLGRVFRDEDELPVSSNLSESITYALDRARFLIVVCTPDLPLSRWCEQEIRYFTETHDRDHVIAVLADGTPETSFSPLMLHTFDEERKPLSSVEPLAANIAGGNGRIDGGKYRKEIYRIYAALLGCRFDELWQRAKRANARRTSVVFGAAAALMAAFSIFLISKNTTIRRQNELISAKNDELTARMSSVRTDLGFSNLSEHYLSRARENGLRAIEDAGGLYDRRAEKLLLDALNAYQMDEKRGDVVFEQEESIVGLETVENGDLAVTLDRTGAITCVDAAGGREIWRYIVPEQSVDTGFSVVDTGKMKVYSELLPTVTEGIVIYKDYAGLIALSLKDGSEVWTYEYAVSEGWNKMYTNYSCNSFRALSEDGRLLAVLDREDPEDPGVELVILDAATGAEKGRVHLDFEAGEKARVWYNQAGAFTEDGSAVACALCAAEGYRYFAVDLETMKVIDAYAAADMDCSVAYGVRYDRASGELFAAQLQPRRGGIVVTIFRRNGKHFSKLTYHTISTDVGKYYDTSEYAAFLQPMLVRGDEAAVMSDEIVLFFNLKTGELLNSCDISGRIVDSCWTEDEKQTLYLLADNGAMLAYRYREGSISQSWFMPSDVSGIGLGRLYKNGFQNDAQPLKFVSVPSDHDARLVAVSLVSDPTRKLLEPAVSLEDVFEFTARFLLSPSAERLFIFRDTRNGTCAVTCYDVQTMTLVSSMTVEEQNKANPAVIDEEHFLYGGVIYGLDGSERRLASSDGKDFSESCFSSIRLSDGSLLTWYGDSIDKDDTAKTVPPYIWLDGEEAVLPEAGKALALEDDTPCYAGGNGLMILNGNAVADGSKKAYFVVYDVHRKTTRYIRDESPAAESFFAAVGTEKPFFASIYDGKRIVFYDMEEESFRAWEGEYQEDEIIRAAFTRGDEYLLILTRKGVLRCYDTATGKPVWSGTVIEELQYIENVNSIEGCILPDGRLAFVSCRANSSEIVIVDMEYDVVLAKISGTVKILPEIGKILYVQGEKTCSFDLHTLDGLLRMARESLG